MKAAEKIGRYQGKPVYRVPVVVKFNDSRQCRTVAERTYTVISHSPADAANAVRQEWAHRPETEVVAYGAKGGETYRYVGWFSAIGHALGAGYGAPQQLRFKHVVEDGAVSLEVR
jgi:hypothetical protein